MYGALWRVLPGPWWVRALILAAAAAVVLTACVLWVFPWVNDFITPQDVRRYENISEFPDGLGYFARR